MTPDLTAHPGPRTTGSRTPSPAGNVGVISSGSADSLASLRPGRRIRSNSRIEFLPDHAVNHNDMLLDGTRDSGGREAEQVTEIPSGPARHFYLMASATRCPVRMVWRYRIPAWFRTSKPCSSNDSARSESAPERSNSDSTGRNRLIPWSESRKSP